jgi:hypothetical protein
LRGTHWTHQHEGEGRNDAESNSSHSNGIRTAALAQDAAQPAQPSATPVIPAVAKRYDPQKQCVNNESEFADELRSGIRPVGGPIIVGSNFLPTGQRVDVGIRAPYSDGMRYFTAFERDDGRIHILDRQDTLTRRAVSADELVRKKLLSTDQIIASIDMYSEDAGLWRKSDMYLYTCGTSGSPSSVSRLNVRISPYSYSLWLTGLVVLLAYFWLAYSLRKHENTFESYLRALNPVKITSGPDGKGSLAKFQVLYFSLLVFALILLLLLQVGMLTDLSSTILILLGINGLGATIAKGADTGRTEIAEENKAWLLRHGWIPRGAPAVDNSKASWRDFFTTDSEFDVYRYQSFIFSVLVGVALVAAGVSQLSSFDIPVTILGILGLSQAVYIGGKLVTRTNMAEVNDTIADLREREKKLQEAATRANGGTAPSDANQAISLVGRAAYDAYLQEAREVSSIFTATTGLAVPEERLRPSIS